MMLASDCKRCIYCECDVSESEHAICDECVIKFEADWIASNSPTTDGTCGDIHDLYDEDDSAFEVVV